MDIHAQIMVVYLEATRFAYKNVIFCWYMSINFSFTPEEHLQRKVVYRKILILYQTYHTETLLKKLPDY